MVYNNLCCNSGDIVRRDGRILSVRMVKCMKRMLLICFCLGLLICGQFEGCAAFSCSDQSVAVEHRSIHSEVLHRDLMFNVYIPPCMDRRIAGGYPVLYLLHGQDMGIGI